MGSIRIRHHAELFVVFDQFVDQQLKCLVVAIVITGSVYQQVADCFASWSVPP